MNFPGANFRFGLLVASAMVAGFQAAADGLVASNSICSVQRERYVPHPASGVAPDVVAVYIGEGVRRREIHQTQSRSDIAATRSVRYSEDDGRTWSPLEKMEATEDLKQNGNGLARYPYTIHHDPKSGQVIELWYHTVYVGDVEKAHNLVSRGQKNFFNHGYYRLSSDQGHTWTELRQLVYEKGAPFNPTNWGAAAYLKFNELGVFDTAISLADGRIMFPVTVPVPYKEDETDRKVCVRVPWMGPEKGYVSGTMCFFGTWNQRKKDYDWTHSPPVSVRRYVSTRGLGEPVPAQLQDGKLLLIMRGSNRWLDPLKYPGRTWFSSSTDGGQTWSPAADLRFDSGEQFYSPAAFSRVVRSSKTGRIYWVGNISRTPPKGNAPRYPLYLAELDENKIALKKATLTLIDDRGPTDTAELQLNNFCVLENRETKDFEIFLTRYGERTDSLYSSDVYKYTLKLTEKK